MKRWSRVFGLLLASFLTIHGADTVVSPVRTPVILDTDIGDDTDDSWALVYALKNPDLEIKLITTTYGKRDYRGALIAKYLTVAKRTDIPIGLGAGPEKPDRRMLGWLAGFTLADYHGKVAPDGVQAMIDTIKASPVPVTIIANGPLDTVSAALQKEPGIAARVNFVGMRGSIRVGYGGALGPAPEFNIYGAAAAARRVLAASWLSQALVPLDTADRLSLAGPRYANLLAHGDALAQALLTNSATAQGAKDAASANSSGSGFDLVGVLLAEREPSRYVNLEKFNIVVDDQGRTVIDPAGQEMSAATSWKDREGFLDHLVKVLLLPVSPSAK